MAATIGIIGGSGIYELDGLTGARWTPASSPFGEPSDQLLTGERDGIKLVFLPRHGRGHRIPPHEINVRANIDALKRAGVTDLLSFSAVGSLREDLSPGTFVIVDQFIDRTIARRKTFFERGCVGHVAFGNPVCARLGDALEHGARTAGVTVVRGGTCLVMEGPQFSTRAESLLHQSWGASVVGMTSMPEAKLAREAEICYASVAMATDFDSWREDHAAVTVDQVLAVMAGNVAGARALLGHALPRLHPRSVPCPHRCDRALDHAIMTAKDARDPAVLARLDAVAGRVL